MIRFILELKHTFVQVTHTLNLTLLYSQGLHGLICEP